MGPHQLYRLLLEGLGGGIPGIDFETARRGAAFGGLGLDLNDATAVAYDLVIAVLPSRQLANDPYADAEHDSARRNRQ